MYEILLQYADSFNHLEFSSNFEAEMMQICFHSNPHIKPSYYISDKHLSMTLLSSFQTQ